MPLGVEKAEFVNFYMKTLAKATEEQFAPNPNPDPNPNPNPDWRSSLRPG